MAWQEYLHNYMREQERADSWHGFQGRFMQLAREEQGRADVITRSDVLRRMDQVLRASCNYQKHPEGWERGKPEQGRICLLETPRHGVWNYTNDGISENFFELVRLCVAEAGRTLSDYPKGTDPEDFWLHRLYLDLLRNNSDLLFCGTKEGGMILSVCVASATFCSRLQRGALAQAENDAKTGVVVGLAETDYLNQPGEAERFQKEVKTARMAVALGDSAIQQAEPSPAQDSGQTAQGAESKPTGRPRKDAERDLVRTLKASGESWKDIAAKVNAQTGQNKSPEAYRSLLSRIICEAIMRRTTMKT